MKNHFKYFHAEPKTRFKEGSTQVSSSHVFAHGDVSLRSILFHFGPHQVRDTTEIAWQILDLEVLGPDPKFHAILKAPEKDPELVRFRTLVHFASKYSKGFRSEDSFPFILKIVIEFEGSN